MMVCCDNDRCEYFDEGACDAGSIDLDDNGVCVTFRRNVEQEDENEEEE